ncbi:MAG TPA: helix-turn-helix domain-containing protein, partial [Candidatus Binatia bacterium]|nr:helix-turn-helix domain-containing protein [Candidatus Binatia bacterium]
RAPRSIVPQLTAAVRADLARLAERPSSGLARRARLILARADGDSVRNIAQRLGIHRDTVARWLVRFDQRGLAGLRHGNLGKSRNRVFHAATHAEIRRCAGSDPRELGEAYSTWSLMKLRNHLIRRGVVRTISHEALRQILQLEPIPRTYWRQPGPPLGPPLHSSVRAQLLTLTRRPQALARRARAVLALADGESLHAVAANFHLGRTNLRRWFDEVRRNGLVGLTAHGSVTPKDALGPEAGSHDGSN